MNLDAQEAALGLLRLSPTNRRSSNDTESINCICGSTHDDGFSIACDDCSRWCHAACFGIIQGKVPEEWRCWLCSKKRKRSVSFEGQTYVHITQDIVPSQQTRSKLVSHAKSWRGITALAPFQPLAKLHPNSQNISFPIPPSFSLHTTSSIPTNSPISPYTSTITPSSTYLADPLNAYAHLGMPKPFVHLMGPPLDLALDARIAGNMARFVRSGCWPNAVLRPVLCHQKEDKDNSSISFAVFALRDLKQGEEVVLGWEWDDGNAVHALPALIQTPHLFEYVFAPPLDCSNTYLQERPRITSTSPDGEYP